MSVSTYPASDSTVLARVPAGAARFAAEHLDELAHEAERCQLTGDAALLAAAGHALREAGWQDDARLRAAGEHLERCAGYGDRLPSTSIALPHELADALLVARGWRIVSVSVGVREFVKPGKRCQAERGVAGEDFLRDRDEALTLALAAEALEANR